MNRLRSRSSAWRRCLALLPLLLLPWAELAAQGGVTTSFGRPIEGQIRIPGGGLPSQRVEVKLELYGMLVDRAFTDGTGRFTFQGLGANTYSLVVEQEGYEPVNQSVTIHSLDASGPVRVVISLKPLGGEPQGVAGEPSPGMNLASLVAALPGKAKKEFEEGVKAADKGKTDDAIKHYRKTIDLAPDFYLAHSNLGYQYLAKGDLEPAQQAFSQAVKLNDADAKAYFGLGSVLFQTEKYADAETILRKGLERDPDSAFAHYLLGSVYFRTGRFPDSEKALKTALTLDSELALAQMAMIDLYLQQQRYPEARAELRAFIERFPDHPMLPQAKELLAKLEAWLASQPPR